MTLLEPKMQSEQDIGIQLRQALRCLASTVTIITARNKGEEYAIAATSFSALSMEPPSVIVCVNRNSSIAPVLEPAASFGVNILSTNHADLAKACGGFKDRAARFRAGSFKPDAFGVLCLQDAQATISCQIDTRLPYGSHDIIVGKVRAVCVGSVIDPLLYLNGSYRAVAECGLVA